MIRDLLRGCWAVLTDPINHLTDDELKTYMYERRLPERIKRNGRLMTRFAARSR